MLKGKTKHIDTEEGKTKHEAPRSANYRATQNKNNIDTIALEQSLVYSTGGGVGMGWEGGLGYVCVWGVVKSLSLYKLHPGSRYNS